MRNIVWLTPIPVRKVIFSQHLWQSRDQIDYHRRRSQVAESSVNKPRTSRPISYFWLHPECATLTPREGGTLDLVITKLEQPLDNVSVQHQM